MGPLIGDNKIQDTLSMQTVMKKNSQRDGLAKIQNIIKVKSWIIVAALTDFKIDNLSKYGIMQLLTYENRLKERISCL